MRSKINRVVLPWRLKVPAAALIAAAWLALAIAPAFAHTRAEIGPYVLVLGWVKEPVIVGERNALVLEVHEGDLPVAGLEGQLGLTVFYGGRSFIGQLAPTDEPGIYTAEIFPTLRGQYEVQIVGMIGEEPVDVILEPEEVLPADVLQFPEVLPDTGALEDELDTLRSELRSARGLAFAGLGVGIVGIALGIFALSRRSK